MNDCQFDVLVSDCWAVEVKAKRGKEGDPIRSLIGNTFRVYSSVQKAIDGKVDEGIVIFVAPGDYRERRWWKFWRR